MNSQNNTTRNGQEHESAQPLLMTGFAQSYSAEAGDGADTVYAAMRTSDNTAEYD